MGFPLAGERANHPPFFAALNAPTGQNIGPNNGRYGVLYEVRATNIVGDPQTVLTVWDDNGQFDTLVIPAGETKRLPYGPHGVQYTGQLVIKTGAAVDVTAVIL
jgi:hypothetical protein